MTNRGTAKTEYWWSRCERTWITGGQKSAVRGLPSANSCHHWSLSQGRLTSKMRPEYIHIIVLVLLDFLYGRYQHYLLPYCHLVCHVLSEATEIFSAGQQLTNEFRGLSYCQPFWRATNESITKQPLTSCTSRQVIYPNGFKLCTNYIFICCRNERNR